MLKKINGFRQLKKQRVELKIPGMKKASESVIWGEQVIPPKQSSYEVHQWQLFLLQMSSTPFSKPGYYSWFSIFNITIFIPNSQLPTLYVSHILKQGKGKSPPVQSRSSDLWSCTGRSKRSGDAGHATCRNISNVPSSLLFGLINSLFM